MINICFSFYYYQILKRLFVSDFPLRQEEHLHTDRLGSGSAVTDGRGRAVNVLGYMHYGETLLDLSQGGCETPYQFTGYEKDQETGSHYAEARYYTTHDSVSSTPPTRCGTSILMYRDMSIVQIIRHVYAKT